MVRAAARPNFICPNPSLTALEETISIHSSGEMKRRMEEDNTVGGEKGELVTQDNLLEPLEQLSKEREEVAELVKKQKLWVNILPR